MKTIRFGVVAAAMLMSSPAWGGDASLDKPDLHGAQQQSGESATPPARHQGSMAQIVRPQVDEGSGGGEAASKRDVDKQSELRREAHEQFLNEVWNAA